MNNPIYIYKGKVMPIDEVNVDTDKIMPAEFLTTITKTGLGKYLFERVKTENPNSYPISDPTYEGSTIMLCRENFGCGSSREHAVWGIKDAGFKALVGSTFSDIFVNNCQLNGIWIIKLEQASIDKLFDESKGNSIELEINIKDCSIKLPSGESEYFEIDPFYKEIFMQGLDPIEFLVENCTTL